LVPRFGDITISPVLMVESLHRRREHVLDCLESKRRL
jgi:hypothetical protein